MGQRHGKVRPFYPAGEGYLAAASTAYFSAKNDLIQILTQKEGGQKDVEFRCRQVGKRRNEGAAKGRKARWQRWISCKECCAGCENSRSIV